MYTVLPWYPFLWGIPAVWLSAASIDAPGHVPVITAIALVAMLVPLTIVLRQQIRWHTHSEPPQYQRLLIAATVPGAAIYFLALVMAGGRGSDWVNLYLASGLAALAVGLAPILVGKRAVVAGLAAAAIALGVTGAPHAALVAAVGVALVITFFHSTLWPLDVMKQLEQLRVRDAALSVAEERLRFSRDLHDVVGRTLSAIAIKAELAAKLADRGDASASAHMREVESIAHSSLRNVRELARGYRAIDLTQELRGARSLLESAGIATTVEGTPDAVSTANSEAAAWVVREATTNILRHARAHQCTITIDESQVVVANDGLAGAPNMSPGLGLTGLRERLAAIGASLDIRCDASTFTVIARFKENA
ncbi:hypothetical protein GCM10011410_02650 [Hoyosella rhizosphaerae]|uniref:Signal transduction histidine kinase subgroup 3 dimerisation and phosphoacceptor domain-containing protein n=2 Tax=Hoyosella rhizosphaerae TaxID=1755582 RepID=A0A916U215_9ACTN|nr:hypothetical protein GCM10011410_02650 [Hoyosella rhizosphaerae]